MTHGAARRSRARSSTLRSTPDDRPAPSSPRAPSRPADGPKPSTLWIGEHEFDATAFSVRLRASEARWPGSSGALGECLARVRTLVPSPAFEAISDRELVVTSDGARSRWRVDGEHIDAQLELDGDAVPTARFLERMVYELFPSQLRVRGHHGGRAVDTGWRPFNFAGLIFVRTTWSHRSDFQHIEVCEHPAYGRILMLDGENQIADSDEPLYSRTLAGLGLTPRTRRACILGGGDCGVLRELLRSSHVEAVDLIELDRDVVQACAMHFPEVVGGSLDDPRVTVRYEDAFAFLDRSPPVYDLVIYDLSDSPLLGISCHEVFTRVSRVLQPQGRLAAQCGSTLPCRQAYRDQLAHALQTCFGRIRIHLTTIPSFNELTWSFAEAAAPRRVSG